MNKKLILGLFVLCISILTNAQTKIAEFSGNGGKNTRPFTVNEPWEISWNADGDIFQLYLYDMTGDLIGVPANQGSSGKGTSFQVAKGQFYLQVNAIGNWTITINKATSKNENSSNVSANPNLVAEFSGDGGKNTRSFKVVKSWEIYWDATGDIFQLFLYDMSGDLIGVPANQGNPGKGSSFQVEKGEFYLQVNAIGKWNLKIKYAN